MNISDFSEFQKQVDDRISKLNSESLMITDATSDFIHNYVFEDEPYNSSYRQLLIDLIELNPEVKEWENRLIELENHIRNGTYPEKSEYSWNEYQRLWEIRRKLLDEKAISIIKRTEVLQKICPELICLSEDVFEVSKVITPIIAGLVITGIITIPLLPVLFATIAILIVRMKINGLCHDYM